jgi:hypothetical protein
VKQLPTLNHLFIPAPGVESDKSTLPAPQEISGEVASAIAAWVASVPR